LTNDACALRVGEMVAIVQNSAMQELDKPAEQTSSGEFYVACRSVLPARGIDMIVHSGNVPVDQMEALAAPRSPHPSPTSRQLSLMEFRRPEVPQLVFERCNEWLENSKK
jgi:hypothetical protein